MLNAALNALIPVILLISFGYILGRTKWLTAEFWRQAEWLSYFVLLPALFINGIAQADMTGVPIGRIFGVLVGSLLITSVLLMVMRPRMKLDGSEFTSVFQGGIRFNNYVGVMVATGLFGAQGTAIAAVCNVVIVPTVNILSVLVFSRFGDARPNFRQVARNLLTNPLILACLFGMLLQRSGISLPTAISGALGALGQAALAIGLLCVGAGLRLGAALDDLRPIFFSMGFKFLILPAITMSAIIMTGLSGIEAVVVLMMHALPTATSSYILSRQLGGNAPLMANIIAVQTCIAALTIPAAVLLANAVAP